MSVHAGEPVVPGLNELVVIDPGAHERGLPAVQFEEHGESGLVVDIPPTLHIHRYYYSGDKEYQGPILQGGPTTIVANHPRTGERKYIYATLPQGTPRIAYCSSSISYIYPDRRVIVKFGILNTDRAHVVYKSGPGPARRASAAADHLAATTGQVLHNSKTVQSVGDVMTGGHELVVNGLAAVDSCVGGVLGQIKKVGSLIPGMVPLQSQTDLRPERAFESEIRRASIQSEKATIPFVRTNR